MQKYIQRTERIVKPSNDLSGVSPPSESGTDSILPVSLPAYPNPIDQRVLSTSNELGSEFPFNPDSSSGNPLGMGWSQSTIENGKRIDAADAYLAPQYLARPNLDVLTGAQVTKLLTTNVKRNTPSFHDVQFTTSAGNGIVHAKKEIILAAGAIGTPQLLMLSGIGDSQSLSAVGVKPTINLPSVGKNMTDHVLLGMVYEVNSKDTFDDMFRDKKLMDKYKAQWDQDKSGPLSSALANQLGWFRLPSNSDVLKKFPDPTAGPASSHFELILVNLFFGPTPPKGNYMTVITNLISPTSRGNIQLKSSNPLDQPLINPNLLGTDFDIATIREAVKASKRFLSASAWKEFIVGPVGDFANVTTDAEIEQYARNHGDTVIHMVGTAGMSPKGADWGVVDPDLKVKNAEGLRIVDASVIPIVGNAHTQAPVYIFAERAADLIKADSQ
jgi:choline dehydrogenase-like flavoprotein